MVSTNDESSSSSTKTIGKHGVTRLQKIHKAKSNGKRIDPIAKNSQSKEPSDKGSCNPGSVGNIPEGLFPVNLYLSSPSRCLVARGKLYNTKGNTVHGMTLPPGYVKVNIDIALVPSDYIFGFGSALVCEVVTT